MRKRGRRPLGAVWDPANGGTRFRVWGPGVSRIDVHITEPVDTIIPMDEEGDGYFEAFAPDVRPGARYLFRLNDERERPDPASHLQPTSVHEASEVVNTEFQWKDSSWKGLPIERLVFYELHVGTFTKEGTFDAIIPHLPRLRELGITCIELMPVAQFPGTRNWGYDGVYPFAAQNSYGGPEGLKRLVDACHREGLAVCLDVVYNHLGPEGNYLWDYGPYFTDRYKTPWGSAVNFDGPDSDGVRDYFLQNALRWLEEFHIDALRLDAVHAIFDFSAYPFLEELSDEVRALGQNLGRPLHLIAESDLNDTRIIRSKEEGGFALDAQWSDDFHHALHSLITGERDGYYEDFGDLEKLQQVLQRGFAYGGEYSRHRKRRHGNDSSRCPAKQFVVCIQNHDQVGNRMLGERMTSLANFEQRKLAAVAVILSPFQPLLFMGEEYGETAPFLFFVSHGDPDLVDAVRKGRREEFSAFSWKGEAPDPQSEETFRKSILDHTLREKGEHAHLYKLYRDLLSLRRDHPVLRVQEKGGVSADSEKRILVRRVGSDGGLVIVHNFSDASQDIGGTVSTNGKVLINTASSRFGGPDKNQKETLQTIAPHSALVIETGK